MAFTFVVKSKPMEENEKVKDLELFDLSHKGSDDERNIYEAYDQLFEKSFKLRKVNSG